MVGAAEDITDKVAQVAKSIATTSNFRLSINMSPGKTDALVYCAGPGSCTHTMQFRPAGNQLVIKLVTGSSLSVVSEHISGSETIISGDPCPELSYRAAFMMADLEKLRKSFIKINSHCLAMFRAGEYPGS